MPTAVVVNLSTQVSQPDAARIIDACNAAVVGGTCELDGMDTEGPPRAIAIVRMIGEQGLSVRIEVGRREQEHSLWSIREIEFSPQDPPHERWRSVGLVLATLVGDIDSPSDLDSEAAADSSTNTVNSVTGVASPGAESNASDARQAPIQSPKETPSSPPSQQRVTPSRPKLPFVNVEDAPHATTDSLSVRLPPPRSFIGVGILGAPGPQMDALRWGAGLRVEWLAIERWTLGLAVDYSNLALTNRDLDVGWFRIDAGGGVRFWSSEHWSLGLSARFGVRALRTVPSSEGSIRNTVWSPLGALDGSAWWRASRLGGVWASIEAGTIGRKTRLLGRDGAPAVVLSAAEVQGLFGFWLAH